MKNTVVINTIAALLLHFGVAPLHAAQVTGSILFGGAATLDAPSAGTATKVTAWLGAGGVGTPYVLDATDDFATYVTPGASATFVAPWSFNSGELPALWAVGGFQFDLVSSEITSQTLPTVFSVTGKPMNGAVTVRGQGYVSGNGYDRTFGVWAFSTQDPSSGTPPRFAFSAGVTAVPAVGAIGNFVWEDLNENGIQDPGEQGIDGVTVALADTDGNLLATTVTASNGFYQFTELETGSYIVTVDTASPPLTGYLPSPVGAPGSTPETDSDASPRTVVLTDSDPSDQTIDFGFYAFVPPAGRIGNFVWSDANGDGIQGSGEPGIDGVTVRLKDGSNAVIATAVTSGGGAYLFSGLAAGSYSVEVDTSSPALMGATPALPNAPGSTVANDSNVNPSTVVLESNDSEDLTVDFGYIPAPTGSIGDFVWSDVNGDGIQGPEDEEPGIPSVTVRLRGSDDVLLQTTTTDLDGLYQFTGLRAGTYRVEVDASSPALAGFIATTPNATGSTSGNDSNPNPASVTLSSDAASDMTIDFGYKPAPSGQIGNFVWKDVNRNGIQDVGEPGINGVSIALKDGAGTTLATTVTSGNGAYLFAGLTAGQYLIDYDETDPELNGFLPTIATAPGSTPADDSNSSPASVTLATDSSIDLETDFGFISLGCGCIGNFVWKDLDCDGIQDRNEPGIPGVTVKLFWNGILIDSATTDSCGRYVFYGLWAGCYSVVIDNNQAALAGLIPTKANAGWNRCYDSNPNPATVCLATDKSCDLTIDFGYRKQAPDRPLTTYTMGGWGSSPSGNNPGVFLSRNFGTVYPAGLTLGGGKTLKFTSAKAVENFLPCGSTARPLTQSHINPTAKLGVLAGQVVALRLGVDFSDAGITGSGLANARFRFGKFAGMTVGQVLGISEAVLGGASLPLGVSYNDLSDACTVVNENFDGGANRGNLIP